MKNKIIFEDAEIIRFITSSNLVLTIDASLKDFVGQHRWWRQPASNNKNLYATSKINGTRISLHRFLTNAPKGLCVDHINGDSTDNRLQNLRVVSQKQNSWNQKSTPNKSSKYKGVCRDRQCPINPWRARIRVDNRLICLGRYPTEEMAAAAYNTAALQHFGEFARLNEDV